MICFYANVGGGSGLEKALRIWTPTHPSEMVILSPEAKPLYALLGSVPASEAIPALEAALRMAGGGKQARRPLKKAKDAESDEGEAIRKRMAVFRQALEQSLGKGGDPALVEGVMQKLGAGQYFPAMKEVRAGVFGSHQKAEAGPLTASLFQLMDALAPSVVDVQTGPARNNNNEENP